MESCIVHFAQSFSANNNRPNNVPSWHALRQLRHHCEMRLVGNRQARAALIIQAGHLRTECEWLTDQLEVVTQAMAVARPVTPPPRPPPDQLAPGAPPAKKRSNCKLANKPLSKNPQQSQTTGQTPTPAEDPSSPSPADPSPCQHLLPILEDSLEEEEGDQLEPQTPVRDPDQSQPQPPSGEKQPKPPRTGSNTTRGLADTASTTPRGTSCYCLRCMDIIWDRTLYASIRTMHLIRYVYCAKRIIYPIIPLLMFFLKHIMRLPQTN